MATDGSRFGYTSEQWQAAVDAGRATLVGVAARRGGTITYTELCNSIKAHSGIEIVPGEYALPYLLGDICDATLESDDIAITTLVTYQGSVEAGSGLFDLAVQRGLLPKNPTPAQKDAFRIEHMNRAYDRWERRRRPGARYRPESTS